MKNEEAKKEYRAHYNPDRECYISSDGKYICYDTIDLDTHRPVTLRYEIGKNGITEELTFLIDDMNYSDDLSDRYYNEAKDPLFEAKRKKYQATSTAEDNVDPWDTLSRPQDEPDFNPDSQPENPDLTKIRRSVEEDLTSEQQDFYYQHFGMEKQLEEIRREEAAESGRDKSLQSVLNRKNKIIAKVAHRAFGVDPVKRRKNSGKEG